MTRFLLRVLTVAVVGFVFLASGVRPAAAADCAFQDVNDNGVFDSGTDIIVPDSSWIGKAFVSNFPFVVPAGCDHILASAPGPLLGVQVVATKIVFQGKLKINKAGGKGIVFVADPSQVPAPVIGDGSILIGPTTFNGPQAVLVAGGSSTFFPLTVPAVPGRSIALFASHTPCAMTWPSSALYLGENKDRKPIARRGRRMVNG